MDQGLGLGVHMTCSELKDTDRFLLSNHITGILGCNFLDDCLIHLLMNVVGNCLLGGL